MRLFTWLILLSVFLAGCQTTTQQQEKEQTGGKNMTEQQDILIQAVENNNLQQVESILKDASYPIDATNEKKESALLIATHHNYVEVAKRLIDAGADVNQQDAIQDSPYLYAGAQGKNEILTYIIANSNPDQQVYNRFGGNTIIPASEKGHLETVKILLKDGKVDINHQNNFDYTALIEAVALTDGSKVYQDIVQVLLDNGADKDLKDASGKTALDYAKNLGYSEMVDLLEGPSS